MSLMAYDPVFARIHELDIRAPEAEGLGDVEVEVPSRLAAADRTSVRPVTDRDDLVVLVQRC
jgi:hypothetical protein